MLRKFFTVFIFSFLFFPALSSAEEAQPEKIEKTTEPQAPSALDQAQNVAWGAVQSVSETLMASRNLREKSDYFLLANYSLIDLLIPSKYGLTFGAVVNADKSWEFEFLRSSLSVPFIVEDLGKMTDQRFSVIGRSYFGDNSFNLSYGLTYFDFSVHLGDKLLNSVSGGNYPSVDLVQIQSVGFNVGIGNRWVINRNITIGVDWLSWAQPVFVTKQSSAFLDYSSSQKDKDDVDKAMKLITYFPRLIAFKFQVGMSF